MAAAREERLAKHKSLEDEAKQLKSDLRATEKKQDELVAAAREKISRDEARKVIIERLEKLLVQTYQSYLRADQRACLAALENLHNKYAVTAEIHRAAARCGDGEVKGFPGRSWGMPEAEPNNFGDFHELIANGEIVTRPR